MDFFLSFSVRVPSSSRLLEAPTSLRGLPIRNACLSGSPPVYLSRQIAKAPDPEAHSRAIYGQTCSKTRIREIYLLDHHLTVSELTTRHNTTSIESDTDAQALVDVLMLYSNANEESNTGTRRTVLSEPQCRDLVINLSARILQPSTAQLNWAQLTLENVLAFQDHLCDEQFMSSSVPCQSAPQTSAPVRHFPRAGIHLVYHGDP